MIEIRDDDDRRAGRDHLALVDQFRRDDAANRRLDDGVADVLLQRRDLRLGGGDPGGRRIDLLRPGAGPLTGEGGGRGLDALLGRAQPRRRHIPSRRRVVTLFDRAGVGAQQILEARQIRGRGVDLRLRGRDVGLRRLLLGGRLPDILRSRAGPEQGELGAGLIALGLRAAHRELGVGRVNPGDEVACRHPSAFIDGQLRDATADLGRHADLRRLDVSGYSGRPCGVPGTGAGQNGHCQTPDRESCALHAILPSSCARVRR